MTESQRQTGQRAGKLGAGIWREWAQRVQGRIGPPLTLQDLPDAAFEAIWQQLPDADRRSARLVSRDLFRRTVRRIMLRPADLPHAADLATRLPALSEIVIQLPSSAEGSTDLQLLQVHGWAHSQAGELPVHVHTLEVEGRIKGAVLAALAHLAASTPSTQRLRLPGLRLSSGMPGTARRHEMPDSHIRSSSSGRVCSSSNERRTRGHHSVAEDGSWIRQKRPDPAAAGGTSPNGDLTGASRDEKSLCQMLDTLPGLVELDLGCPSRPPGAAGSASGGPAPLPRTALLRIMQLHHLQVLCADASALAPQTLAAIPDATPRSTASSSDADSFAFCASSSSSGILSGAARPAQGAAALIRALPLLRCLQLRVVCPDTGSTVEFAAALCRLSRLEHLELESGDLGDEFCGALQLGALENLQCLALGLCPELKPEILRQVSQLPRLQKLTLPFPLDLSGLRHLAALPLLSELLTMSGVHLAGACLPSAPDAPTSILALPPVALAGVTKLVASTLRASKNAGAAALAGVPRWELDSVFPALRSLYLRRGGDEELQLAAGCGARLETLSVHTAQRATDAGVALLRACRGLARLQLEDASRVSSEGLARLFEAPLPSLNHLAFHGVLNLGDDCLQAATASCRRLISASLACCPELTDKTLARMARMERLSSVQLVRLGRGVTAEGIRALAAAPAMQSILVAGCPGVKVGGCRQHRRNVKIRIDDDDV